MHELDVTLHILILYASVHSLCAARSLCVLENPSVKLCIVYNNIHVQLPL